MFATEVRVPIIDKSERRFFVYLMISASRRSLYTGLTNDLIKRVAEHKSDRLDGFSKQYKTHRLVYYEVFLDVKNAIDREKEIKGWRRSKKDLLIKSKNPGWTDLSEEWH